LKKLLALLLFLAALPAAATSLTGTITAPDGSHPTGGLWLELNQPANLSAGGGCGGPASLSPGVPTVFTLTNGVITGPGGGPYTVFGNDCIVPSTTYYRMTVITTAGSTALRKNVLITGSSSDIGTLPGPSGGGGGGGGSGITSVNASGGSTGFTFTGGPITAGSGVLTLGGTLGTANGGTNATAWTAGAIPYLSSATQFGQDPSNLFYDGPNHRLGIGTAAPAGPLDVRNARTSGTNANSIILSDPVTGSQTSLFGSRMVGWSNSGSALSAIGFEAFGGTNNDTALSFYTQASAGSLLRRMLIDSAGKVGIGTSAPQVDFEVSRTTKLALDAGNGFLWIANSTAPNNYTGANYDRLGIGFASNIATIQTSAAGTGTLRTLQITTGGAVGLNIDNVGKVGIGLPNPSAPLHLYGNTGVSFRMEDAAVANATWALLPQTGNTTKLFRIQDVTAAANRLVIDGNGSVGIGTNVPSGALDVSTLTDTQMNFFLGSNGTPRWRFIINSTADKNLRLYSQELGQYAVDFQSASGKVYLSEGTATSATAQVGGTVFTQTATQTVSNTATETTLFGSGVGSLTLPAGLFVAGRTIRITIGGEWVSAVGHFLTIRLKVGGTTFESGQSGPSNFTNSWMVTGVFTCRTTGAPGTGFGTAQGVAGITTAFGFNSAGSVNITTTGTLAVDVTGQWNLAGVGDSVSTYVASVEVLN
jgi:hypothetical protein